jgi:hypothetical protein
MIKYIAHRVNKISESRRLDPQYGVEIDLRDNLDGKIYLEHDPFKPGEDFEEYCAGYRNGLMILNIKSERVEYKALEIIKAAGIKDYFFLDSSFPMIWALSEQGNYNTALRFSEYEGLDTIRGMAGRAKWVWVDCFTKMPLVRSVSDELSSLGYKICVVSPELQGQPEKIERYAARLKNDGIAPDAVCCKVYNIEKWQAIEGHL